MFPRLAVAVALALTALAAPSFAAPPSVAVTTCGQVIPRSAIGYLTSDLDCTGFHDLPGAVIVSRRATFELRGFTLTGGQFTVLCGEMELDSMGNLGLQLGSRCTIQGGGGTVRGAESHGVLANQLKVYDLRVEDCDQEGIYSNQKGTLENVTVTGSGGQGVRIDGAAIIRGSTITGSGEQGVAANRTLRISDSIVRGNGTGPDCPYFYSCVDIRVPKHPSVVRTDCDRSGGAGQTTYGDWDVCLLD